MQTVLVILVVVLAVAFSILAGLGHTAAASLTLLAGFLLGVLCTSLPTEAERAAERERQQAARTAENLTRIY